MQFIIPIETKVRELESKILLLSKILSKKKNCSILFGNYKKIFKFVTSNKMFKICFEKGLSFEKERYLNFLSNNIIPVILDEEGVVCSRASESLKDHRGRSFETSKYIFKVFAHGKNERDKWINNSNVKANKILITGNPRFELCKPSFFKFFEKTFPQEKNVILINSAFGNGNSLVKFSDQIHYYKNYKGPFHKDYLNNEIQHHDYQKKLFKAFFENFNDVLNFFKEEKFIFRPHPLENVEIYNTILKNFNIEIVKNTSVTQWVYKSKMMIHPGCATALEGYFGNVPAIFYSPKIQNEESYSQYLPVEISDRAENIDQLIKLIKSKLSSNNFTHKDHIIKNYVENEHSPSDRITESLINISQKDLNIFKKSFIFEIIFFKFAMKIKRIILNLFRNDKISKSEELHKKNLNKLNFLLKNEIQDRINHHSNLQNLNLNFVIKSLDNDVFLIQN